MTDHFSRMPEAVKIQAAAWLARLRSDERTEADVHEFQAWLHADPAHAAAFEVLTTIWDAAGAYPRDMRTGQRVPAISSTSRRAVLTSLMLAPMAAAGFIFLQPTKAKAKIFKTGIGGHEDVTLPDASHARLDTSTRIDIMYNQDARDITLQYGRVNLDVAPDKIRPFTIHAAHSRIIAGVSNFDAHREGDRISVVMFSGQVAVHLADRIKVLVAGERLEIDPAQPLSIDRPNLAIVGAWHHGRTIFKNTHLSDAAAQMNRYSSIKIRIRGSHLGNMRISGVYRNGNNVAFAKAITKLLPAQVVITPTQALLIEDDGSSPAEP